MTKSFETYVSRFLGKNDCILTDKSEEYEGVFNVYHSTVDFLLTIIIFGFW